MKSVFIDDRLDPGQFGDLMNQGLGILAAQGVATTAAGMGLTVGGGAELLGRDQGPKRLAMAGLSPALARTAEPAACASGRSGRSKGAWTSWWS
jgi:hypothetical protein